jgi:hypothetical protein
MPIFIGAGLMVRNRSLVTLGKRPNMRAIAREPGMPSRKLTAVKEKEWQQKVKGFLKAELKRKNVTYAVLVQSLQQLGFEETEDNIKNKISRGTFSATFLFQCMEAIGTQIVALNVPYYGSVEYSGILNEDRS